MTNQQIIDKVNQWQNAGFVHPLTCGKNSQHQNLVPELRFRVGTIFLKVILKCPDCDYVQHSIPDCVLSDYVEAVQMTKKASAKTTYIYCWISESKDSRDSGGCGFGLIEAENDQEAIAEAKRKHPDNIMVTHEIYWMYAIANPIIPMKEKS